MRLLSAGLSIYDLFSGNPLKRRHRMLPAAALLELETHLNPTGLVGGGLYYDFLTDDARFTIDVLKGAADAGALVGNYLEVTGLPEENGKVAGVSVANRINGETGVVRARQVINTAGPWVDAIRFLEDGVGERLLRPTRGVHVVVRKHDFPLQHAVFVRSPRDNRVVWPIPALDEELVYIGTTDTDYDGPLDHVTATEDDIDYLLEVANFTIPDAALDRTHIVATWAGLRPLIQPEGGVATSSVPREQQTITSPRGRLSVAGGELTTSRVMGRQVIDAAMNCWGRTSGFVAFHARAAPPSRSAAATRASCSSPTRALPSSRSSRGCVTVGVSTAATRAPRRHAQADPAAAQDLGVERLARRGPLRRTGGDGAHGHGLFCRRASVFYWTEDGDSNRRCRR